MSRKGIVITGHSLHGKDTVAEYLLSKFGLTYSSSSSFANDLFIFDTLKGKFGYSSKEECFNDRRNHKGLWFNLISKFNTPDKAKLGQLIFEKHVIYCGIRCVEELNKLKELGLVKAVYWVDASLRLPIQPDANKSITIQRSDADFIIDNNKDLGSLYSQLYNMFK